MAKMPSYARKNVILHCVRAFRERFDDFAYALAREAGKPIKDARGEVTLILHP